MVLSEDDDDDGDDDDGELVDLIRVCPASPIL